MDGYDISGEDGTLVKILVDDHKLKTILAIATKIVELLSFVSEITKGISLDQFVDGFMCKHYPNHANISATRAQEKTALKKKLEKLTKAKEDLQTQKSNLSKLSKKKKKRLGKMTKENSNCRSIKMLLPCLINRLMQLLYK
jgi:predicted RNase H-like nuclease (RuvC/YqgF family)